MKKISGNLKKLKSVFGTPVNYYLSLQEEEISLNKWLNKSISLNYTGVIYCTQCGRKTNKSFQQGFCFPCLRRLQECNLCVIHPERCRVEMGCPTDDWAHAQCHQKHVVYLANSSGLKVGITRETQIPTRWIDQGAIQAIPIFYTANRYQAGVVEVALKKFVADRTDWRRMLKNEVEEINLIALRDTLWEAADRALSAVMQQFKKGNVDRIETAEVTRLDYPVLEYPKNIKTLSLEASVTGRLLGIKGQYLILDNGVINIRKYSGYGVTCILEPAYNSLG